MQRDWPWPTEVYARRKDREVANLDKARRDFVEKRLRSGDAHNAAVSESIGRIRDIKNKAAAVAESISAAVGVEPREDVGSRLAKLWMPLAIELADEVETYAREVAAYEADVDQVFDRLDYDPGSRSP